MTDANKPKAPDYVLGAALPLFSWTVRVPVPGNDQYLYAELPLLFQAVDQDELDWMRGLRVVEDRPMPTEAEVVQQVVKGWPALRDAQGNDVPFSAEALAKLMAAPMVRVATVATYFAAMTGTAARKNV
jgi:hypothetical protein